jgi:hypothetical protein
MFVHLCFGLAVGEGLDDAETAWGWTVVEPDDRAVDVPALVWLAVAWPVVAWVPVVAAPAAVRLRAKPPPRTAAPMAVPTSGRKILMQFSLACCWHPRPEGPRADRWPAAISTPGESGMGLGATYHDTLNWPAGTRTLSRNLVPPRPSPTLSSAPTDGARSARSAKAGPELARPVS